MDKETRLMIVDDSPHARKALSAYLSTLEGFKVIWEASNGKDAVQKAESQTPDMVLMDVHMPVMDGLEATRLIKERWPQIKVIILTIYTDYQLQAQQAGADAFLVKGCSLKEMNSTIRDLDESTSNQMAPTWLHAYGSYGKKDNMHVEPAAYRAKAFEARNLAFFFLLVFGLTWVKSAITIIFNPRMPTSITDPAILFLLFIAIPGGIAPTLAAFLLTAIREGRRGIAALWKRFWNPNLSIKWLLAILLCFTTLRLIANLIVRTLDGQTYPILALPHPAWMVLPLFLTAFLNSVLFEEFGWRGYVLPRFQARWNALTSSILLGVIWASWHIPFFFTPGRPLYQRNFWEWLPMIILSSVLYTWIFNNTKGSVLATALFHATVNYSPVVLPTQASLWWYYAVLAVAVTLIVLVFGSKDLVRQKPQRVPEREKIPSPAH